MWPPVWKHSLRNLYFSDLIYIPLFYSFLSRLLCSFHLELWPPIYQFFPSFLSTFLPSQIFTNHLLCARHWARCWRCNGFISTPWDSNIHPILIQINANFQLCLVLQRTGEFDLVRKDFLRKWHLSWDVKIYSILFYPILLGSILMFSSVQFH